MSIESGEAASANLGQLGAIALGWGVVASAFKIVVTLAVQAALARLLGPAEFGAFALGLLVIGVAGYFSDIGLATGLVQRGNVTDEDVRFVFTVNLAISLAVATVIFFGAGFLAAAFDKPAMVGIFRAFSPVLVLNALASVSASLLRRKLDYRTVQLAGLVGYAVGFGLVGVSVAWLTSSTYAMVAAFAVQSLVTLIILYAKTRHKVGLCFKAPASREHLAFGGVILATNLVNWATASIDRVVIGKLFSSVQLGLYSAAYNLVHAPVGALYPNLQSVVFSTTARMQGNIFRLRKTYLDLLQAVVLFAFPAFVGLSLLAEPLLVTVYGPRWAEAAQLASLFALMAPFLLLWAISTPILWNTGQKLLEAKVQIPFVAVAVVALVRASEYSLIAVGWTAVALFASRTLLISILVLRTLGVGPRQSLRRVLPGLLLSMAVGVLVATSDQLLLDHQALQPLRLLDGLLIIASSQLLSLLAVPALLPDSIRTMLGRQVANRGAVLGVVLRRLAIEGRR